MYTYQYRVFENHTTYTFTYQKRVFEEEKNTTYTLRLISMEYLKTTLHILLDLPEKSMWRKKRYVYS